MDRSIVPYFERKIMSRSGILYTNGALAVGIVIAQIDIEQRAGFRLTIERISWLVYTAPGQGGYMYTSMKQGDPYFTTGQSGGTLWVQGETVPISASSRALYHNAQLNIPVDPGKNIHILIISDVDQTPYFISSLMATYRLTKEGSAGTSDDGN